MVNLDHKTERRADLSLTTEPENLSSLDLKESLEIMQPVSFILQMRKLTQKDCHNIFMVSYSLSDSKMN